MNDVNRNQPLYKPTEKVEVRGWTGTTTALVKDVQWVYHHRTGEYVWGYKLKYDGDRFFSMDYVPEGYLRKIKTETEN